MTPFDDLVAERLHAVRGRIERAGGVDVEVLAVTKSFPVEACWAAARAGCRAVGENYAQEVVAKFATDRPSVAIEFIGQLQSNKVRLLVPFVTRFSTVDRPSLVRELARRAPGAHVLIQAQDPPTPGKGGCPLKEVPALVDTATAAGLQVDGLLAVGPTVGGVEAARPLFRAVRAMATQMGLHTCSMGMSDDLEVAVQEGSTQVRVGTALFGERPHLATIVR